MDLSVLQTFSFWPHLSEQQKTVLLSQARAASYPAGYLIGSSETDCLGILIVQTGILRVYLYSDGGREATISRLTPGECCIFSASCLLSAVSFHVQLEAETALEAVLIPSLPFSNLMKDNLYVENFVYRSAAERFSDVIHAVEQMMFSTLEQRIASFLLDETARLKTDTLSVTQEQLAQRIGSARESVTRTLKQMASCQCIRLFRGGIQIQDRKALYKLAAG